MMKRYYKKARYSKIGHLPTRELSAYRKMDLALLYIVYLQREIRQDTCKIKSEVLCFLVKTEGAKRES